jgi:hypothetical protein
MTRRSQQSWQPPATGDPIPGMRGPRGSYDPFYVFEKRAQPGKPAPVPKRELQLTALLGSKAALAVMGCLLATVVATLLLLLVTRA